MTVLRTATFAELDAPTLYALLRLRVDVFVVEQVCAYPELDGRDAESGATHWWLDDAGRIVSYLRLLAEPYGATRLGRVATVANRRGEGLAGRLVDAALRVADRPVIADVQTRLVPWYARFGFEVCGLEFDDAGIPHVPTRLG